MSAEYYVSMARAGGVGSGHGHFEDGTQSATSYIRYTGHALSKFAILRWLVGEKPDCS